MASPRPLAHVPGARLLRKQVRRLLGLWWLLTQAPAPRLAVTPLQQIEAGADGWEALGSDPQLELSCHPRLVRGLCRVRFSIRAPASIVRSRLYVDAGSGFSEGASMAMDLRSGDYADGRVYLPLSLRRLRLDPGDQAGRIEITDLALEALGLWATLRYLVRERLAGGRIRRRVASRARGWLGLAPDADYVHFQRTAEPVLERVRPAVESHIARFSERPCISVLMPTWNTPPELLDKAIGSVVAQVYPHWQLCIADDGSTDAATRQCLREWALRDERVILLEGTANGGISVASNRALDAARGEFVTFLDHDDELAALALYHVAAEIDRQPDLELIYTDEDKLDARGRRSEPHFKTAWNPELLHAQNYITHLAVYRTATVRRLGGMRPECDGSQDHDLALRFEQQADARQVRHVPVVLYHWRAAQGSTAGDRGAKGGAHGAGERALRDRFVAEPGTRVASGVLPLTYRVDYAPPAVMPRVSVLIPTRDGVRHARNCVDSIRRRTDYPDYELIVVDNQSQDHATLDWFREIEAAGHARVLPYDAPFNFSAINNHAARAATGEVLVLLNDDTEVISPQWMAEMATLALRASTGAVGAKLHYPDGTLQHAGVALGIGGVAGHTHWRLPADAPGYLGRLTLRQAVGAVTAACLAVSKRKYFEVGGLDEEHLAVAFNDVDLCLKLARAGYRNLWTPHARLYHFESISRGAEDTPEKVARFNREADWMKQRWGEALTRDPYYHRCLSLTAQDMSLNPLPAPYRPWEGEWPPVKELGFRD